MRYRERLNIIFMRDNGPRRSIRLRRSRFYLLVMFFLSLPFITILLALQCWLLWDENSNLRANMEKFEMDYQTAEQRAERLENLELLLREENVSAKELLLRQLAREGTAMEHETASAKAEQVPEVMEEGPGHEEFPAIDTGRVKIDNVQVRAMRGHSLRVGLDLRNPENEKLLSGEVSASLLTANGETKSLAFTPQGAGNFRINRYKRAVMNAATPVNASLVNASVILEVREQDGAVIYKNIFPVQH